MCDKVSINLIITRVMYRQDVISLKFVGLFHSGKLCRWSQVGFECNMCAPLIIINAALRHLAYISGGSHVLHKYSGHSLTLDCTGAHVQPGWFCMVITLSRLGVPFRGTTHTEYVWNHFTWRRFEWKCFLNGKGYTLWYRGGWKERLGFELEVWKRKRI